MASPTLPLVQRPLPHVLVLTSGLWQTNAISTPDVLVDCPVHPGELALLPDVLLDADRPPPALLLTTHPHFDHVLAPTAFPGLPWRADPETAAWVAGHRAQLAGEVRDADLELYLTGRPDLGLERLEALAGDEPLDWVPAPGHAPTGAAFELEGGLLCPGDYLCSVEVPLVSKAGSAVAYRATLERLEPLVRRAEVVVPGHGLVLDRDEALRLHEADLAYLTALLDDPDAAAPPAWRADWPHRHRQRRIKEANAAAVRASGEA